LRCDLWDRQPRDAASAFLQHISGYRADLAVFDPGDFRDLATYANPHQYPSGARTTVIVNGIVVVENASHAGATPGLVLRRGADGQVS
jgi:N-acyl-D-aspartate/D-glutamate deacylase